MNDYEFRIFVPEGSDKLEYFLVIFYEGDHRGRTQQTFAPGCEVTSLVTCKRSNDGWVGGAVKARLAH